MRRGNFGAPDGSYSRTVRREALEWEQQATPLPWIGRFACSHTVWREVFGRTVLFATQTVTPVPTVGSKIRGCRNIKNQKYKTFRFYDRLK